MTERRWVEKLAPGVRVRIVDAPSGLFDAGDVLEVIRVDGVDGWLHYESADGDWEGQCDLAAFGDGSMRWEVVR